MAFLPTLYTKRVVTLIYIILIYSRKQKLIYACAYACLLQGVKGQYQVARLKCHIFLLGTDQCAMASQVTGTLDFSFNSCLYIQTFVQYICSTVVNGV